MLLGSEADFLRRGRATTLEKGTNLFFKRYFRILGAPDDMIIIIPFAFSIL